MDINKIIEIGSKIKVMESRMEEINRKAEKDISAIGADVHQLKVELHQIISGEDGAKKEAQEDAPSNGLDKGRGKDGRQFPRRFSSTDRPVRKRSHQNQDSPGQSEFKYFSGSYVTLGKRLGKGTIERETYRGVEREIIWMTKEEHWYVKDAVKEYSRLRRALCTPQN